MFIFDREREHEQGRGQRERDRERDREAERERETGREREGIESRLCTDSREPDMGLHLTNHEIMTWAEVRHLTVICHILKGFCKLKIIMYKDQW